MYELTELEFSSNQSIDHADNFRNGGVKLNSPVKDKAFNFSCRLCRQLASGAIRRFERFITTHATH